MITTHMGNGIVKFDKALNIASENLNRFIDSVEATEQNIILKDGEDFILTDGGYRIPSAHVNLTPKRFTELYKLKNQEDVDFLETIRKTIVDCVVEYCKIFPVVIENIRWMTNGYIIKYENGQFIGPHSDCNIAYESDGVTPINTLPMHNILTCGLFLNEDFTGGELHYRPWGITAKPSAGSVLIYPSSYMGCHEVAPVTNGTRYAYLCWFGHGDTKNPSMEPVFDSIKHLKLINSQQSYVPVGVIKSI